MVSFRVTVDDRAVRTLLDRVAGGMADQVVERGVAQVTREVERDIKEALSGRTLNVRSNRYRSSITTAITRQGARTVGEVGTTFVGAMLHERGGTVSAPGRGPGAKGRQFLAVPLPAVRTAAGVPRLDAPTALKAGAFFPRARGGGSGRVLAEHAARGIRPLFALVRSVRIPARPIWGPAHERALRLLPETIARLLRVLIGEGR